MPKKGEFEVDMSEIIDYHRITGTHLPAVQEVAQRKFTADAAKRSGIKVTGQELQKGADVYRYSNGLASAKDTETWLKFHGISVDAFEKFLETNILMSKFKDKLEQEADPRKCLDRAEVREVIRTLAYEDWLAKNLK